MEKEKRVRKSGCISLTIIGYILLIIGLLIIAPVVCSPIFGYHTYTVNSDSTGNVNKSGSLVYTKVLDDADYSEGKIVAVENTDNESAVDVYYVSANDSGLVLEDGDSTRTVEYSQVKGRVVAKTPYIGYLSQLCFSVIGIVIIVVIFLAAIICTTAGNIIARKKKQEIKDLKLND